MDSNINPFPIGPCDDFQIYLPPDNMDEAAEMKRVISFNQRNIEFIRNFKLPEKQTRIKTSFVYAHPADYKGRPMVHATVAEWRTALQELKAKGIDSVIFQSALWREINECFYMSKNFSFLKCNPVIEHLTEAAEIENIKVYLGGYGSVAGWRETFSEEELKKEIAEHKRCFDELKQFKSVAGFYFPSETSYFDSRLPEKEKRMNYLYRNFVDMVKSYNSDLRVISSPATMHRVEKNEEFKDFWHSILENSHMDIIMPQDCIGNACSELSELDAQWKAWKDVTSAHNIELWSHTEIFERRSYMQKVNLHPCHPDRVAVQLALTAPYVTNHACWEMHYFANPASGSEGERLDNYFRNITSQQ